MKQLRETLHAKLKQIVSPAALYEHGQGVLSVNPHRVHTNILMVDITKENVTAEQFCHRLAQVRTDCCMPLGLE